MAGGGIAPLDLPIVLPQVIRDCAGDLVLFVLRERSAHSANHLETLSKSHHDAQTKMIGFGPHRATKERIRNDVKSRGPLGAVGSGIRRVMGAPSGRFPLGGASVFSSNPKPPSAVRLTTEPPVCTLRGLRASDGDERSLPLKRRPFECPTCNSL